MLAEVAVPYVDTSAAALGLWLDLPAQPALEAACLEVGGLRLDLRVLGASHQVVALAPGGGPPLTETVACRPGAAAALPACADRVAGGLRHRFESSVARLDPPALRARARALRTLAEGHPDVLAGVFPGSPDAITAIGCRAVGGGAEWWTAHVYPGTGEVVTTRSVVEVA